MKCCVLHLLLLLASFIVTRSDFQVKARTRKCRYASSHKLIAKVSSMQRSVHTAPSQREYIYIVGFLAHSGSGVVCHAHCRYPQQTLTPSPLNSSCSYLPIESKNKHAVLTAFSPSLLPHASPFADVHWFPVQSITALPYLLTGSPRYLAARRVGADRQKGRGLSHRQLGLCCSCCIIWK